MSDIPEQNSKPDGSADSQNESGGIDVSNLDLGQGLTFSRVTNEEERVVGKRREAEDDTVAGAAKEGLYSAAYSLHSTGKGVLQLIDKPTGWNTQDILPEMDMPAEAEFGSVRWHGQQIGGALGILGPFALTHAGVKRMTKPIARSGFGQKMAQSALLNKPWKAAAFDFGASGAVFEFAGRAVEPGQDFWETRAKHGLTGFATFSTLGATSVTLGQFGKQYVGRVANPTMRNMASAGNELIAAGGSGLPAGAAHSLAHDYLHSGKLSSWTDIKKNAYTFAVVGVGLGIKDIGMRQLGVESKSFLDQATEAMQNRSLNESLTPQLTRTEANRGQTERGNLDTALNGLGIKQTDVRTAETVRTKPTLTESVMANLTGKGRQAELSNRVLAEGEARVTVDVPPEHHASFQKGMQIAESAARNNSEANVGKLAEFLNGEGAPIRANMYEAAHLYSDFPMIQMFNQLMRISENQSGVYRGEYLANAAAKENAPAEVRDAFAEYARTDGVNMGHYLMERAAQSGNQSMVDITLSTYRGVEASPVAKQAKMTDSIAELATRSTEAYKAEPAEAQVVKTATEVAAERLMRQLDPNQTSKADTFDYARMNERMQEFERGLDILTAAKRDGTEVDATRLSDFAKGDGAKVGRALLEWAHIVDNPVMVKQLETAFGMEATGMSGMIKGEALAKAASRPEANEAMIGRFEEYANGNGESMGFYLLNKAAEINNPNMEFVVATTYGKNLDSPLGAALNKGGQLLDRASGLESNVAEGGQRIQTHQMVDLINFAMTEGSNLGRALEYGAVLAGNPRAQTAVREAYLVAQGKNVRQVGDAKLQVPEFLSMGPEGNVPFPTQKLGDFLQLVSKDLPTTVEGYANFRIDILEHLAKNPELSARINNELSPYNGMTVAEIVSATTQHSMIAGPIDFYFKTNNGLSKFEGTAVEPVRYNESAIGGESALRAPEFVTSRKFAEFDAANGMAKQVRAEELMGDFSTMTPGQFKQWLDFVHRKSETGGELTNLREMTIPKTDVLARPEVVEALRTDTTGDGVLNQYRQMLSDRPATAQEPLPSWVNKFVARRIMASQTRMGAEAKPNDVLADALPKWLLNKIGERVELPREGNPSYEASLGADLVSVLNAAAKTDRPGLDRLLNDRKGNRDSRQTKEEGIGDRLDTLEQVLNVKDAELAGPLLELGSKNPQALRQILGKLNPETSAPEYAELLKLVLPKAESINDVSLLLDTVFVGNKASQAGRKSKRNPNPENTTAEVQSYHQLAMNALNVLVEPGSKGHGRANEIVEGLIQGTIRDPFKPRDNGRGGGRFGDRGGQGRGFDRGGRNNNRDRDSKEGGD